MQCPYPVSIRNPELDKFVGWSAHISNEATFNPLTGEEVKLRIEVPCGRCIICREQRRNMWADRLELESREAAITYFCTFTYNEQNCPAQLQKQDLQKFFKRFRHRYSCRFFACGEYGDHFHRPHYHAVIFLQEMVDKETFEAVLREKWPFGFVMARVADREAFRYVAKYTIKYLREVPSGVELPFAVMSRRPGISASYADYFENYFNEYIILESGARRPLPDYLLSKVDDIQRIRIKEHRKEFALSKPQLSESELLLRSTNVERSLIRKYNRNYGRPEKKD